MRRLTPLVFVGCLVLITIAAVVAVARGETEPRSPADSALALSHELISPFCPGLTLSACPSMAAYELRKEVLARLERGESRESVVDDLIHRYGTTIRGTPPARGVGMIVWTSPLVVAACLGFAVRAVVRREPADGKAGEPARPFAQERGDLARQLDDELGQM